MTKIQTIDEFNNIKKSEFGFIVVSDGATNTMHQSKCKNLDEGTYPNKDGFTLYWFSTIAIAEKSFMITPCKECNPEG